MSAGSRTKRREDEVRSNSSSATRLSQLTQLKFDGIERLTDKRFEMSHFGAKISPAKLFGLVKFDVVGVFEGELEALAMTNNARSG